jgi:bifunctional DNA-binding transcriptional regulator/antitoxin component of YhaV-PrlF toxin-antitoxin module
MANKTTIQEAGWGGKQLRVTVPRAIGEAMRLKKGDKLEWLIASGDVIVRKV